MFQDHELKEEVLAEFRWEPSITYDHIEVAAHQGVVTLTGQVPHFLEKIAAEQAGMRVKGVKAVVQELEVRLPDTMTSDDQDIARAALDRLAWETSVPTDAIQVKVEKGWVTLTGKVSWHYQKDAAERTVGGLIGVLGAGNHITVKPHADASNIDRDLNAALHRSWFDPRTINVTAIDGKVTLTGNVRTRCAEHRLSVGALSSFRRYVGRSNLGYDCGSANSIAQTHHEFDAIPPFREY